MSLLDALIGIFTNEDNQQAFQSDPEGYLVQNGFANVTSQDIEAEMPRVLEAVQGNSGGASQGGAADFSGSGNVVLPAGGGYGGGGYEGYDAGGLSGAVASINHYQSVLNVTDQTFEDNDVTTVDDRDVTVDDSVNQNITAFGDVHQDFDNDVVSGDGAVAAGDGAPVNTGDGAVQAGGDISDAVVGDDNAVIADSSVGAASFGAGDANDISSGGDLTHDQGDGDLTQIQDSTLDHSALGDDATIVDNDTTVDADDGASIAFGEGSTAVADTQDVDVHDTSGTVQVGGDDSAQTQDTDNSIDDSFNTSDSYNPDTDVTDNSIDDSFDTTDSYNPDNHTVDDHAQDNDTLDDNDTTTIDANL